MAEADSYLGAHVRGRREELRQAIEDDKSVVLFHLHNHYALISGWRELCVEAHCLAPARAAAHELPGAAHGGCQAASAGNAAAEAADAPEGEAVDASVSADMARRRQVLTARLGQTQQHVLPHSLRPTCVAPRPTSLSHPTSYAV